MGFLRLTAPGSSRVAFQSSPLELRSILLPLLGGPGDADAIAWAALLARSFGSQVEAVAVVPRPPRILLMGTRLSASAPVRDGLERLEAQGRDRLRAIESGAFAGVPTRTQVAHGEPAEAILAAERAVAADLLVVDASNEAVSSALRGYARACTLLVKGPPACALGIVAGWDRSANADRALEVAGRLSQRLQCPCEVTEATPRDAGSPLRSPSMGSAAPPSSAWPSTLRGATYVASHLPPSAVLLEAASRASLVVVGARGSGPLGGRILGRTSECLARDAQASVLVVR